MSTGSQVLVADRQEAGTPKLRHQLTASKFRESVTILHRRRTTVIAVFATLAILVHLVLRFALRTPQGTQQIPLLATLVFGGIPLVYELTRNLLRREFGSDLLAGISIVTSVLLGEYLAGTLVVLMLSGGEAIESYACAERLLGAPSVGAAHAVGRTSARKCPDRRCSARTIAVGDTLVIFPHEISPVDGEVIEGHGVMDESFLTGEPFRMSKTPGSTVISGAVNGEAALTITPPRRAVDSRYAKIMEVMRESEQKRGRDSRRLGDQLGAVYTPVAVGDCRRSRG